MCSLKCSNVIWLRKRERDNWYNLALLLTSMIFLSRLWRTRWSKLRISLLRSRCQVWGRFDRITKKFFKGFLNELCQFFNRKLFTRKTLLLCDKLQVFCVIVNFYDKTFFSLAIKNTPFLKRLCLCRVGIKSLSYFVIARLKSFNGTRIITCCTVSSADFLL